MPTQQDVLDAFDSLGGRCNQPMALQKALEAVGFDVATIASAIKAAIDAGVLIQIASGAICKP